MKACILPVVMMLTIVLIPIIGFGDNKYSIDIKYKEKAKSFQIYPNKTLIKYKIIYGTRKSYTR